MLFLFIILFCSLQKCFSLDKQRGRVLQQSGGAADIKVSYRLDKSKTLRNPNTDATVQLSLRAAEASVRAPVVFNVVLDSSASLGQSNQFDIIQETTDFVIDSLISDDYFGLVAFRDNAEEVIRLGRATSQDKESFKSQLRSIESFGDSNLAEGVLVGLEQHQQLQLQQNYVRGTIIVSDGDMNIGITDPSVIESNVRMKFQSLNEQVRLFTVATEGAEFQLLEKIAGAGEGALLYLSRAEDLQKAFGLQFGGLISTYYQDVIMNISPKSGVTIGKVSTGGKISRSVVSNEDVQITFEDFRADEGRDLVVELEFDEGVQEPDLLIEVKIDYVFYLDDVNVGGNFQIGASDQVQEKDPLIDVSLLRFATTELLNQAKTLENKASATQLGQQVQELAATFEEVKQGGIRERLQSAAPSQSIELGFGGTRRLLQSQQEIKAESSAFDELFNTLNLTLQDALEILPRIGDFLDDTNDEDFSDLQRLLITLDTLQLSLQSQRLEIVPSPEFKASEAVGSLLITPVQDAFSRGINFFEKAPPPPQSPPPPSPPPPAPSPPPPMPELFITVTVPAGFQFGPVPSQFQNGFSSNTGVFVATQIYEEDDD